MPVESDSLPVQPHLLSCSGLSKGFPGVQALDDVAFTLRAGEVHALMGENGAGKSTLIKLLTGVYPRDSGSIQLSGKALKLSSPLEAERAGIATVYQEVNLIPELSVAENILLGRQPRRFGFLQWREIHRQAEEVLHRLGLDIDASEPVSGFSMAVQQMVAIARALFIDAKLLILDEPTSSLDEQAVSELFTVMRKLRDEGLGIIFVAHFLDQVYEISDLGLVEMTRKRVGEGLLDSLSEPCEHCEGLGHVLDEELLTY